MKPLGIESYYTWDEIGTIFRLVDQYNISLLVETGVGNGDLAAWMVAKATFDPEFSYLGITNDPGVVHPKVAAFVVNSPQVFVSVGVSCSNAMLGMVQRLIHNSSACMVLCSGVDVSREVQTYTKILRPGDIIAGHKFASEYKGTEIIQGNRNGQMSRILVPGRMGRIIAGVLT